MAQSVKYILHRPILSLSFIPTLSLVDRKPQWLEMFSEMYLAPVQVLGTADTGASLSGFEGPFVVIKCHLSVF